MIMAKNNKDVKYYTIKIAYNRATDTIEYIEESDETEFDYAIYNSTYIHILDYYSDEDLAILDESLVIGES
tara:strand:+ start:1787 stop:1999 length:213 start_codon:yes stop_codon:yes gene_type:complete